MIPSKRSVVMPAAAALVCALTAFVPVAAQDDEEDLESMAPGLHVMGAWTRESMMDLAAGAFMVIHNNTDFDDALVGASSPAAGVVEIHQTTTAEDGTMGMAPVEEIPVPAHGDAILEPGGYHVMLIDLAQPLEVGTEIELTLQFANAEPQTVTVPVQAMGPMDAAGDMDQEMDDMQQSMDDSMDEDEDEDES